MTGQHFTIGGDRMDALMARHADQLAAAEAMKFETIVADQDVSPAEMIGLMLRASVGATAAAISAAERRLGLAAADVRDLAVAAIDHLLADGTYPDANPTEEQPDVRG